MVAVGIDLLEFFVDNLPWKLDFNPDCAVFSESSFVLLYMMKSTAFFFLVYLIVLLYVVASTSG